MRQMKQFCNEMKHDSNGKHACKEENADLKLGQLKYNLVQTVHVFETKLIYTTSNATI